MTERLTSDRIAERLVVARRRRFVGRAAELELFRTALEDARPPFTVLFVHGPGGVGKSTLLSAMADAAADAGVPALRLDLRGVEPSPPAFAAALGLGGDGAGAGGARTLGDGGRFVLLLDTFEQAAPLEAWLREGVEQERVADLVFLHRSNPFSAAYWDWASFGEAYGDALRRGDLDALLAMARRHEGEQSAALVAYWLDRQPQSFVVFRGPRERPIGFAALLALHEASAEDLAADPGAASMWAYTARRAPARPGEPVLGARFFMDAEAYQAPSPSFNVITIAHAQHILGNPRRAWDLIGPWAFPDQVEPMMSYIDFQRAPEADFEVGGRGYGVFAHDWRRTDVARWLDLMAARERATGFSAPPGAVAAPVLALTQQAFAGAVRRALRDLHRPDALAGNPLMRSRLIADRPERGGGPAVLVEAIEEAVNSLAADPRDAKLARALTRTYLRPAPTQEAAAEVLGLPFSTYRRHLTRGVERVVDWLWQRELYGPER